MTGEIIFTSENVDAPEPRPELEKPKPSRVRRFLRGVLSFGISAGIVCLSAIAILVGYSAIAPAGFQMGSFSIASFSTDPTQEQPGVPSTDAAPSKAIPVKVAEIVMQDSVTLNREFPGQLEAGQTSHLAFEFGGYVTRINVDEGDKVERNQILAALDIDALAAERAALLATKDAVNAQLKFAESDLERANQLRDTGNVSVGKTDQATASRDELVARVAEVEARLLQLGIRINKSTLSAPFDGVIGQRHIDVGNTVGSGTPVVTLFEDGAPLFRVGLPPDLEPNSFENIQVEIQGAIYPATLKSVRPDVDPVTRMRTVLFDIERATVSGFGLSGTLTTTISRQMTGAWVPLEAMRAGVGDAWTILIVDPENIVQSVLVEPLYIGTDRAFVFGAFDTGDRVIVAGGHKISPGQLADPV